MDRLAIHPEMASGCTFQLYPVSLLNTALMGSGPHTSVKESPSLLSQRTLVLCRAQDRPVWRQGYKCQGMLVAGPSCDLHSPPVYLGGPVLSLPIHGYNHYELAGTPLLKQLVLRAHLAA